MKRSTATPKGLALGSVRKHLGKSFSIELVDQHLHSIYSKRAREERASAAQKRMEALECSYCYGLSALFYLPGM